MIELKVWGNTRNSINNLSRDTKIIYSGLINEVIAKLIDEDICLDTLEVLANDICRQHERLKNIPEEIVHFAVRDVFMMMKFSIRKKFYTQKLHGAGRFIRFERLERQTKHDRIYIPNVGNVMLKGGYVPEIYKKVIINKRQNNKWEVEFK